MATTRYGVNSPETNKVWAKKLYIETLSETIYGKLIGSSTDSVITMKDELKKQGGDRVRVTLRMLLTGAGTQGDATLEGNEEALATYTDDLYIDQLRHAVRSDGKMSEQRILFDMREQAKAGLRDWWADRWDVCILNQLTGNTGQTDTRYTGNQAAIAPTASRLFAAGSQDTEASLSATVTHSLNLREIDRAVAKAKTLSPLIRPAKIDGKSMYVLIIHPYQTYQLRRSTDQNTWFDITKAALQGGLSESEDKFYRGMIGIYNNTLILEDNRIPVITGTPNSGAASDYRRAVFCGAQAGIMAMGRDSASPETEMSWNEESFDYGNQMGVEGGSIFGVKKAVFNSTDFATLAISGYAPAI